MRWLSPVSAVNDLTGIGEKAFFATGTIAGGTNLQGGLVTANLSPGNDLSDVFAPEDVDERENQILGDREAKARRGRTSGWRIARTAPSRVSS